MTMAIRRTAIGTHCQEWIGAGSDHLCHASYRAKRPPMLCSTIDTMKA